MRYSFFASLSAVALTGQKMLVQGIRLPDYDDTLAELDAFLPLDAGTNLAQTQYPNSHEVARGSMPREMA